MPLPPAIRSKLQSLVLMLSSEQDGERLAATGAIGRVLKVNGLDWHDLAATLAEAPQPPPPAPQRAPEAPHLRERPDGKFEIAAGELAPLILAVREQIRCDNWTDEFLTGMEDRAARWDPVILSEKQIAVLTRLIGRIQV